MENQNAINKTLRRQYAKTSEHKGSYAKTSNYRDAADLCEDTGLPVKVYRTHWTCNMYAPPAELDTIYWPDGEITGDTNAVGDILYWK